MANVLLCENLSRKFLLFSTAQILPKNIATPHAIYLFIILIVQKYCNICITRIWANAQPDGRPGEHRWRPLFNAAKFG